MTQWNFYRGQNNRLLYSAFSVRKMKMEDDNVVFATCVCRSDFRFGGRRGMRLPVRNKTVEKSQAIGLITELYL